MNELILIRALNKYGLEAQLRQTQEECAELIHGISKWFRFPENEHTTERMLEEVADVMIMCEQIRTTYPHRTDELIRKKLQRLEERLNQ